jgi:DNA-directed RNA polymerase subunit RPC12/RpoP
MNKISILNSSYIFCPYCENGVYDEDFEDGTVRQITCKRCGGKFRYEAEISYSFDIQGVKPGQKPALKNPVKKKIVMFGWLEQDVRIDEVDAEEITIPGFEEFQLFLRIEGWEWIISEESTGMVVCSGSAREETIEKATSLLNSQGKEKFKNVIARQPKIDERV